MPHLRSLEGVSMLRKYVSNWHSVIGVYIGLLSSTTANFRDGERRTVSRKEYNDFYEGLYRRHNIHHGFTYSQDLQGNTIATSPTGLRLAFGQEKNYSFVLDEIFIMKVYGNPNVKNRVVIDVGAAIGDSALYFASLGAEVYAFEPKAARYSIATRNILENGFGAIHLFNRGLHGGSGDDSLANLLVTYRLDDVFLKMDCEGCEYDIILNSSQLTFEKISDVVLEYHGRSDLILSRLRYFGFDAIRKGEIIRGTRSAKGSVNGP